MNKLEDFHPTITREMPCPHCLKAGRPKSLDVMALLRHEHHDMIVTIIEGVPARHGGITPHFVEEPFALRIIDNKITIDVCCAINGCGINVEPVPNKKDQYYVDYLRIDTITLDIDDYYALISDWHGYTGYEM